MLFGVSTAIDGNVAVVGSAKSIGSPLGPALAAHVFRYDSQLKQWNEEAQLDASNSPTTFLWIAQWLAIDGNTIAFGDVWDTNGGRQQGSVFLYQYNSDVSKWIMQSKLVAPDGSTVDNDFGFAVAVRETRLVVGAPDFPQVNPPQDAGSAYFFDLAGEDCNANGICDSQDIASGASLDINANGIPDECEPITGDIDGDGLVNSRDLLAIINAWGPCPLPPQHCPADLDGDGSVNQGDLDIVLAHWSS
jgi:hypothetical protein